MRRIQRVDLSPETANALRLLQDEVDSQRENEDFTPRDHWNGKRKTQTIIAVLTALKHMAGTRQRCMYCVDSEGSDIEHFWPMSAHSNRIYMWENLLLNCAPCGRFKGNQFPRTGDGEPLLIDPSAENPWDFLDFDPSTGNLNARYLLPAEEYSAKGETTIAVLHLDKREGLAAGYRKTYDRLCRLFAGWADDLETDYLQQLREADDHGLLGWFLHGSGGNETPFSRFRELHQDACRACVLFFS